MQQKRIRFHFPVRSLRAALLCLLVLAAAWALSACETGVPSTASAARDRIRSLGFPNEISFDQFPSGSEDGRRAVLLYGDAEMGNFFQAVLYESGERAEDAYRTLCSDDLLAVELEKGGRVLDRVSAWVVIGPPEAVRQFSGGTEEADR